MFRERKHFLRKNQTLIQLKYKTYRGGRIISIIKLNWIHITLSLKTHLHAKLMFPLACTFLTTKQYDSIPNILNISPVLSSMEYNHT